MTNRSRREVHRELLRAVQSAMHCLADTHMYASSTDHPGVNALLSAPRLVELGGEPRLGIGVSYYFRVALAAGTEWRAEIVDYDFRLVTVDRYAVPTEREIFAYHFHPLETPAVVFPHLHVESDMVVTGRPLKRVHFRTGHITLQDFLRVLTRDFDVRPRQSYVETNSRVLDDTERRLSDLALLAAY